MQQVTVTGYLIPRVGEGPQPVSNYDQNYIKKTGIDNLFDAHPPFSSDWYQGYDPGETNYIQRFFSVSVDKKF